MPLSRYLWLCLFVGIASVAVNAAAKDVQLDEDLYNRALAHAGMLESKEDGIAERLRRGGGEALYEVAKSMNDSGDKISSVLIWHALADDGSEGDNYEVAKRILHPTFTLSFMNIHSSFDLLLGV